MSEKLPPVTASFHQLLRARNEREETLELARTAARMFESMDEDQKKKVVEILKVLGK